MSGHDQAKTDLKALKNHLESSKGTMQRGLEELDQVFSALEARDQRIAELDKLVDDWYEDANYYERCADESHRREQEQRRRAEDAEADKTRLKGALEVLYASVKVNPDDPEKDALCEAMEDASWVLHWSGKSNTAEDGLEQTAIERLQTMANEHTSTHEGVMEDMGLAESDLDGVEAPIAKEDQTACGFPEATGAQSQGEQRERADDLAEGNSQLHQQLEKLEHELNVAREGYKEEERLKEITRQREYELKSDVIRSEDRLAEQRQRADDLECQRKEALRRAEAAEAAMRRAFWKIETLLEHDEYKNSIALQNVKSELESATHSDEKQPAEDDAAEPDAEDGGEWVEWHGGECPVAPDTLVDVEFKDGDIHKRLQARGWKWIHHKAPGDIIRYRVSPAGQGETGQAGEDEGFDSIRQALTAAFDELGNDVHMLPMLRTLNQFAKSKQDELIRKLSDRLEQAGVRVENTNE